MERRERDTTMRYLSQSSSPDLTFDRDSGTGPFRLPRGFNSRLSVKFRQRKDLFSVSISYQKDLYNFTYKDVPIPVKASYQEDLYNCTCLLL